MADTHCQAVNCVYHHPPHLCGADQINVTWLGRKACCNTFQSINEAAAPGEEGDALDMVARDQPAAGDTGTMNPVVVCKVTSCLYYGEDLCYARQILVTGQQALQSDETQCKTYSPDENNNGEDPEYTQNSNHLGYYYY